MPYVTVQEVRDVGITQEVESQDDTIIALIALCQEFFERATRQWFEARAATVLLDGTDSDTLHFPVPIITVSSLKLNDDDNALDSSLYKVYSGRDLPDDRKNPRIKLVGPSYYRDIYTAPLITGRLIFRKGRQNQEVTGTFGYTEPDDSTPLLVKRAIIKLVVEKLTRPIYVEPGCNAPAPPPSPGGGVVVEEATDGHRIKYAAVAVVGQRAGLSGFTQDPEVQDIIRLYKAPLAIAASADWSYL